LLSLHFYPSQVLVEPDESAVVRIPKAAGMSLVKSGLFIFVSPIESPLIFLDSNIVEPPFQWNGFLRPVYP